MLDPENPEDYEIMKLVEKGEKEKAEKIFQKRQASRKMKRLWHKRIVPYEIHPSLGMMFFVEEDIFAPELPGLEKSLYLRDACTGGMSHHRVVSIREICKKDIIAGISMLEKLLH